jgi:hypothetical protein
MESATLSGAIHDPKGGVVPEAEVVVTLCAMGNRWVACALIFWKFLPGHFP